MKKPKTETGFKRDVDIFEVVRYTLYRSKERNVSLRDEQSIRSDQVFVITNFYFHILRKQKNVKTLLMEHIM